MSWIASSLAATGDLVTVFALWFVISARTIHGPRCLDKIRSAYLRAVVLVTALGWAVIIHGSSHPLALTVVFPLAAFATVPFRVVSLNFSGVD